MPPTDTRHVAVPPTERPLVVFDGECGFCRLWAERWDQAWGDRIELVPSQLVRSRFPEVPAGDFDEALQLIDRDGRVYAGAEAVMRARSIGLGRRGIAGRIYEGVPGAAAVADAAYRCVAHNRPIFSAATRLLWGRNLTRPQFGRGIEVFLRLLAICYGIAFVSFWVQLNGLIGPHGILPAQEFLDAVREQIGAARWYDFPTLCWLFGAGAFLHVLCATGVLLSIGAFLNRARLACLIGSWLAWLSLATPGQMFLGYQWDTLLLESGLMALAVVSWRRAGAQEPPRAARWLVWWLLIRLMILSGAVKLASGDATWRNLTALEYHYWTQPLPTWIGWWANQAPAGFQRASCLLMFVIELGFPLLLLGPRRLRHLGVAGLILLQVAIALTGNYTIFNLLAIALTLPFLDDAWWSRWLGYAPAARRRPPPAGFLPRPVLGAVLAVVLVFTTAQAWPTLFRAWTPPNWMGETFAHVGAFRSLNNYGLFMVMTTTRPEIIVEGSDDGSTWKAYEFKAKPGELARRPPTVAPHQPRLDWQLWFAALRYPEREPWVGRFLERLLRGEPAVLGLLRSNPFPAAPPRYVRAVLYDYTMTSRAERAATGNWWRRSPIDYYIRPVSLR
ncbi:MAG TPA: lipase maturation factor family protein [Candidatus Didemnitutus sp.]|jgi:predicted DCC family thiol-disulfide oxidoreductase YuxK